jgi:hypothetical protein
MPSWRYASLASGETSRQGRVGQEQLGRSGRASLSSGWVVSPALSHWCAILNAFPASLYSVAAPARSSFEPQQPVCAATMTLWSRSVGPRGFGRRWEGGGNTVCKVRLRNQLLPLPTPRPSGGGRRRLRHLPAMSAEACACQGPVRSHRRMLQALLLLVVAVQLAFAGYHDYFRMLGLHAGASQVTRHCCCAFAHRPRFC